MTEGITTLIRPFLVALLLSVGLGYPAILLARRLDLMDHPGAAPHKQHAHPTPLAGGLVLAFSLAFLALFFHQKMVFQVGIILASSVVILGFGLWDDAVGLSASKKFLGQLGAALLVCLLGVRVQFFSGIAFLSPYPGLAGAFNIFVTLFWLVGVTNAFNLIDSMDGLVAGLSSIAFLFFTFAALESRQIELVFWLVIMLGLSLGLYFWNGNPARFFLGDGGAQTIGFILASMAIIYNPLDRAQASSWFVPILLVAVPILDTSMVVFSRLRRGLNPFAGGLDHTYHRLVMLGLDSSQSVRVLHGSALVFNCLAFLALPLPPLPANAIFTACLLLGILLILLLDSRTHKTLLKKVA